MKHSLRLLLPLALAAVLLTTAALAGQTATPSGAPIAQTQSFETCKNVAYMGRLTATDPEGDALTFQLVDKPARGSVEITDPATGDSKPVKVHIAGNINIFDVTSNRTLSGGISQLQLSDRIEVYGAYGADGTFEATSVIRK